MRLDKYLCDAGICSRRDAQRLIRGGAVSVDGETVKKPEANINPTESTVVCNGETVLYREHLYIMMNKPIGYVSSTDDPGAPIVLELLPERFRRMEPFPCGRLDRNTEGFMLLTNDGQLSHKLLAPSSHVPKTYYFELKFPYSDDDISALEAGIEIEGGYTTLPCKVCREGERTGTITIHEGKYHQIKLMMKAVHNQVTALRRLSFGPLELDPELKPGKFRELTVDEVEALKENSKK